LSIIAIFVFIAAGLSAQPSAGRIVFIRGGNVWIMHTDGSGQQQLTTAGGASSPRLENGVVTFIVNHQLYRTDTHGAAPAAIPNTNGLLEYDLSPDATQLTLTFIAGSNFTLYRMNIDGSGLTIVNDVPGWHQIYPSWGRDNNIYFGQTVFGNPFAQTIWKTAATAVNSPVHLTDYFTQYPRLGLASNRVVFVYNQPAPHLRTMRPDGSDQTDVPNSPFGVFASPAPDDDLDIIYYEFAGQIWRINLDGTNNVSLTTVDNDGIDFGKDTSATPDTTPPTIVSITSSPSTLWPANHKMVPVSISVVAVDDIDPSPQSHIVSVTSNQPANATGDGNTPSDWMITGPLSLDLRAERSGSGERVYTVTIATSDASGNTSTAATAIRVPHDQR
jgi:hypothetical protein